MNMMAGPPCFKRAIVQVGEARASLHPSLSIDLDGPADTRYTAAVCLVCLQCLTVQAVFHVLQMLHAVFNSMQPGSEILICIRQILQSLAVVASVNPAT